VRNHWHGGWIMLFWKFLRSAPMPFGTMLWDAAKDSLRQAGGDPAEAEIAAAAANLLTTLRCMPGRSRSHRGRRCRGRTSCPFVFPLSGRLRRHADVRALPLLPDEAQELPFTAIH
jgi:hypothetical protein